MPIVVIVEKTGELKQLSIKAFDESKLYTKAGFKSAEGFVIHHTWNLSIGGTKYNISMYAKINGLPKSENKYAFPSPLNNTVFFGNCILVNYGENKEVLNITLEEWNRIYNILMAENNTVEYAAKILSSLNAEVPPAENVVETADSEEEDMEIEPAKRKTTKRAVNPASISKKKSKKNDPPPSAGTQEEYIGCTSELTEEPYM